MTETQNNAAPVKAVLFGLDLGEYDMEKSMEELAANDRAAIVVLARTPKQTGCTLTDGETQMLRSVTAASFPGAPAICSAVGASSSSWQSSLL